MKTGQGKCQQKYSRSIFNKVLGFSLEKGGQKIAEVDFLISDLVAMRGNAVGQPV